MTSVRFRGKIALYGFPLRLCEETSRPRPEGQVYMDPPTAVSP